jgi:hypothetical protein
MNPPMRPVFRADALQGYTQRKDKIMLPRLSSPALFICRWFHLKLLLVSGSGHLVMVAGRL